ncbi:glycosyl hydrolase 115 family protein, partial [Edaphobacter sp. HDX4]|uniref:glycosyl hydrolase 115 family protein n=1 Tax=Edaphobacter sp. HDX4 TaxID=2794064 RepID=UPI002FE621F2
MLITMLGAPSIAQELQISNTCTASEHRLLLASDGKALPIYVAPDEPELLRLSANAFAADVERVTGVRPKLVSSLDGVRDVIIVGTFDKSPQITELAKDGKLDLSRIRGKWESSITASLDHPTTRLDHALVIAGSDRRGAAFALFALARQMGVSPWEWWADVPVHHAEALCLNFGTTWQGEPSVRYRGIFLNDEDWGLRPWAAKKMDPELRNIGPHTYEHVFELLLRLRANSLWPAMHPGTLPFNAIPENARLADEWGIVMGSSHSEAMLRNNVGEWDEARDGPWNYQTNRQAIDNYWRQRLVENGKYENFYTVGMRGLHDSGLEARGTDQDKARLVDESISSQRRMLATQVNPQVERVPQVFWLYKESLDLYRAGMKIPDDVTLGWTDDNYGYLRQLSSAEEQKRSGGSAVYYHVS